MNIVITGSSKGLGKAFAKIFSANNQLFLCARNLADLEQAKQEIEKENPSTKIYIKQVDMSKKQEVIEFGAFCLSHGKIDILINNAGVFLPGSVHNEAEGTLEKMIETNLYSCYYLTRTLLPTMIENKAGHIFNICSIASIQPYANGGSYSISKYAMLGFSKNLREELKPHQIKVTSVLPGAVYTNSWAGSGIDEDRIMKDTDIAKLVKAASELSFQACVEEILIKPQLGDL